MDDELRESESDLLFSVPMAGMTTEGRRALVCVLLEHQSRRGRWMGLRLLRYMARIWERQLRQGAEVLPPIIPIVLSHAQPHWSAATTFSELVAPREGLTDFLPNFCYLVDDLQKLPHEALMLRDMPAIARIAGWVLRDARWGDALMKELAAWGPLLEEERAAHGGGASAMSQNEAPVSDLGHRLGHRLGPRTSDIVSDIPPDTSAS